MSAKTHHTNPPARTHKQPLAKTQYIHARARARMHARTHARARTHTHTHIHSETATESEREGHRERQRETSAENKPAARHCFFNRHLCQVTTVFNHRSTDAKGRWSKLGATPTWVPASTTTKPHSTPPHRTDAAPAAESVPNESVSFCCVALSQRSAHPHPSIRHSTHTYNICLEARVFGSRAVPCRLLADQWTALPATAPHTGSGPSDGDYTAWAIDNHISSSSRYPARAALCSIQSHPFGPR